MPTPTPAHQAAQDGAPAAAAAGPSLGLSWSLVALLREWSTRVDAATEELPQGMRGYQVLRVVVHDSPPTQAALAARLGIDRTVMTYLIDSYVECGLVERQQDPADRRARRIVATAHGRKVLAGVDVRVAAAEEDLLSGLPPEDRVLFRELLERAARGVTQDDDPCGVVARATTPPDGR
ncbi:MarR family winged helix-turn-helix transcriptional regulator [Myceligenerans indicum]|uniref:Winged helix-turn-helix transcriptional regulator n=1 Tax=Myceligenerans indicum TaxID=2593663 RepID=A0ABS1LQD1_9MICO|nr:MarR family winged helix-turn-helix transcriptional regulator [Myceligenerans indicum]MBL0888440.1 winged helix-turn-helix transcriptional regulator [Myceligenerans indicum]